MRILIVGAGIGMMFIENVPLAWGRDQALKFYSLDQPVKQIARIFEQPL
jgi:hypothetical protein